MWIICTFIGILCVNTVCAQYGTYMYSVLNRPTNQSSVFWENVDGTKVYGTSDKAVDEDTGNDFTQGSCTHTEWDNPAWWVVDLGGNVPVHSVTITNRLGEFSGHRLDKFSIFGVAELFYSETDRKTCLHFDGEFGDGATRTLTCDNTITTRFLAIAITVQRQFLTLCDVQITAVCKDGTFGHQCTGKCSPNCKNSLCDKFTQYGTCPDGECIAGYDGLNCTEVCPLDKYGPNCVNDCPMNCKDQCTADIGKCNGGCSPGYTGDICETVCPLGKYGLNCEKDCSVNCKDQCTAVTGKCNGGCNAGYTGDTCERVCPLGKYGPNCEKDCSVNCKDQCTAVTGKCNGGCNAGYTGDTCETVCTLGKYGQNCEGNCSVNCKDQCMAVTGKCIDGCKPGYTGNTCETECHNGTFGQDCEEFCHCKEGTCHYLNGMNCPEGCAEGYTGDTCSERIETTTDSAVISDTDKETSSPTGMSMLPVIIGVVIGILVLLAVLGAVFIVLRRKRKMPRNGEVVTFENNAFNDQTKVVGKVDNKPLQAPRPPNKPAKTHSSSTQELFDESTLSLSTPDETSVYANVQGGRSKTMVRLEDVGTLLQNMSVQKQPFLDEYEDIPKKTSTWDEAGIDALKAKNRYINILPYDNNRVKLKLVGDDPLSSYINASFIKDYDGQVSYIASLGPTEKTLEDTWRMIWEQGIATVIMVTNLMEDSKTKCVRYWPTGKTAKFGQITVSTESAEHRAHLVKRVLKASMHKQSKIVTHYHYKAWPDKKIPGNLSSLLQLRKIVKTLRTEKKVPILVHCSAGIGRTGTFIAFDILMDQADKEGAIDVYQCVTKLREQRTQLVQTLEQYVFLYTVFHEMTNVGTTLIPSEGIHQYTTSKTFEIESSKQFSYLQSTKPTIPQEDLMFGQEDNPDKNRDQNVIAGDDQRVMLLSDPDLYINAVYVSDYEWARAYCVTQLPLQHTVVDFWRMVFELKSNAVVCLETDETDSWESIPQDDSPLLCDNMYIRSKQSKTEFGHTIRKVEVSHNMTYANLPVKTEGEDIHEVDMYEFKNWTDTPLSNRVLTPVQHVVRKVLQLSDRTNKKPLIVMCRNGAFESGLFVALLILMDNLKSEHEIDVYQVVKLIRKSRPQFIISQEQFNWLYKTIERIAHHK